jgi:DNA topoisomerase 2-associated protein PAT1
MLTMLVANFESLDVCRTPSVSVFAEDGKIDFEQEQHEEEIDLFMNTVMPPMLGFIAEAPFRIAIGLMALFLERNNVAWVGRSKAGLVLLTSFLSRAEILKQPGGGLHGLPPASDEELQQWQELYARLFSTLQGHFLAMFPPDRLGAIAQIEIDDLHVWQFLAAMAVGASMEQQHVLVTEVRERVLDNVVQASSNHLSTERVTQKIQNVNLFLHALGLDASQVSVPQ